MAARGILSNPAMYAGYQHTPIDCVRQWVSETALLACFFFFFSGNAPSEEDSTSERSIFFKIRKIPEHLSVRGNETSLSFSEKSHDLL